MIFALPFLLAATTPATTPAAVAPPAVAAPKTDARITAVASAEIVAAVEISFKPVAADKGKTDRQLAKRGDTPMVEFY